MLMSIINLKSAMKQMVSLKAICLIVSSIILFKKLLKNKNSSLNKGYYGENGRK